MLDEVANAGSENLDPDHVARYDNKEDAAAYAEVTLCKELGLDQTSIAVDVSPVMLARLGAKTERAVSGHIEVVEAGFLSCEHRGRRADFVDSRYALHHLPDFWKAVAQAAIRPANVCHPAS
jgi:hypothetical protein